MDFDSSILSSPYYITSQSKELPIYEITKDGFSMLVMGYNGEF